MRPEYQLTPVQSTSLLVAYWRDLESRGQADHIPNHKPLIQDPPAQALLDALLSPSQRQSYHDSPIRPYGIECLATRTRALDDWLLRVQHASAPGNNNNNNDEDMFLESKKQQQRQLVNLGAGMCCRPYRLAELPQHFDSCWEVDSDLELLKVKRSILQSAGYQPHLPVVDVSIDLSCPDSSLTTTLLANGCADDSPTDWIAEGLFAYLHPDQHAKVFSETADLSITGSRMAITVAEPAMDEFWLSLGVKLPYNELVPIDQVLSTAQSLGWKVDDHIQPQDWSRLYPGRGEHLPGYNVVFLIKH
jgi:methyltransferase (TIGR00027 family)